VVNNAYIISIDNPTEPDMPATQILHAADLQGPADLYDQLLAIKNGFADGSKLGHYSITKQQAKAAGIPWTCVTGSCEILGLKIVNRHGRRGHAISL
jgi:hypothetical protein